MDDVEDIDKVYIKLYSVRLTEQILEKGEYLNMLVMFNGSVWDRRDGNPAYFITADWAPKENTYSLQMFSGFNSVPGGYKKINKFDFMRYICNRRDKRINNLLDNMEYE